MFGGMVEVSICFLSCRRNCGDLDTIPRGREMRYEGKEGRFYTCEEILADFCEDWIVATEN